MKLKIERGNIMRRFIKGIALIISLVFILDISNIGVIEVNAAVQAQYMDINSPINGYETGDSFHITGWAVNKNGVSKVKVYVDNNFVGDAYYGAPTDGLKTSYPDYVGSDKAGYDFLIDSIKYGSGNHLLKVEVTGNDGVITNQSINIKLTKSKPAMDINSPSNGATMNNGFHITGWAVNKSGVKEVRVYSNNNYIGQAYYGASTTGLLNTFGDYSGAGNAGYDYYVDTNKFANGSNNLTVEAIGNDGQITRQTISVALSKSYPAMDISSPQGEITTDKSIHITGWAVNKNGVKKINVYDNGNYVGQAYYGASTPSLNNTFGGYSNAGNAGFDYNVDINSFSSGKHEFKIEAEGIDGNKISQSTIINIIKKSPMMDISSPNNGQTINGGTHITGWAIAPSGIKNITVYLNSTNVGNAYYGAPTPALQSSYGDYSGSSNGGYDFYLDSKKYYNGDYTLKIEATTNSGEKISLTRNVKFSNIPIMDVNSPTDNSVVTGDLNIGGWALSGVGISRVTVNIDDSYAGQANLGISTPGLIAKSDYPNNQYAGYYLKIDSKLYGNGIHKVTVVAQAKDGSSTYIDRLANFQNNSTIYVNYPNTLNYYSGIQMNHRGKPQAYDSANGGWRDATLDEVLFFMNPNNFVNDSTAKYMFLRLDYSPGVNAWQLNQVLKGKGILEGKGDVFVKAGQLANVNPIYLVSHALLETGNGTSRLSNGSIIVSQVHQTFGDINSPMVPVETHMTYNVYGIGAYDSNPDLWGSEKAYSEKWFTIDDAIIGGASWISKGYIANTTYNQNTLYKMRWDFSSMDMSHQYATDVAWAYNQTRNIKSVIDQMGDPVVHFEIPIFKN
jgi:beta-N-acetylglucosaminidase